MKAISVDAPGYGQPSWTVRVRVLPRRRSLVRRFGAWRKRHDPDLDLDPSLWGPDWSCTHSPSSSGLEHAGGGGGDGGLDFDLGDDLLVGLAVIVGLIVVGLLAWWVVIPLLLAVIDLAALLVLVVLGLAARVLLRRPWEVEATSSAGHRLVREVVGYRNALRVRDETAQAVRAGVLTAPAA